MVEAVIKAMRQARGFMGKENRCPRREAIHERPATIFFRGAVFLRDELRGPIDATQWASHAGRFIPAIFP